MEYYGNRTAEYTDNIITEPADKRMTIFSEVEKTHVLSLGRRYITVWRLPDSSDFFSSYRLHVHVKYFHCFDGQWWTLGEFSQLYKAGRKYDPPPPASMNFPQIHHAPTSVLRVLWGCTTLVKKVQFQKSSMLAPRLICWHPALFIICMICSEPWNSCGRYTYPPTLIVKVRILSFGQLR